MAKKRILLFILIIAIMLLAGCDATSLSFKEDSYTVGVNKSIDISIKVIPFNADVTLTVSNSTIAKVDGLTITGLKTGLTTLTITSGKKTDTATLIVSDVTTPDEQQYQEIKGYTVNFFLSNFDEVYDSKGVLYEAPLLDTKSYFENQTVNDLVPTIIGYSVDGWYLDANCTNKYANQPITSNFDLYCKATVLENAFLFDSNKYVSGILYKNIPHENLIFPDKTNQNETCLGIADHAFMDDTIIKEITIPDSYTYIGTQAFAGCTELTTVNTGASSQLQRIGALAFSITCTTKVSETTSEVTDDLNLSDYQILAYIVQMVFEASGQDSDVQTDTEPDVTYVLNTNPCSKLTTFNLPDSITEIGTCAFYGCSNYTFELPNSLEMIRQGAFSGTKVTSIDLTYVRNIYSYAFSDCTMLNTVTNASNVRYCGGHAFDKCKFITDVLEANGVAYADTILVESYKTYGRGKGSGKLVLANDTTLLGNYVFYGDKHDELTVFFPETDHLVYIGAEAFLKTSGVNLVVPQDLIDDYTTGYPEYASLFCYKQVVTIEGSSATTNCGIHTFLVFPNGTVKYDSYAPYIDTDSNVHIADTINLTLTTDFPSALINRINRINMRAFNLGAYQNANLNTIILGNTIEIGYMAIYNCPNLSTINLTNSNHIVSLANSSSIQFSTLSSSLVIIVNRNEMSDYAQQWSTNTTAVSKLRCYITVSLNIINYEDCGLSQMSLANVQVLNNTNVSEIDISPYLTGYSITWYLDAYKTNPATTIPNNNITLYGYGIAE